MSKKEIESAIIIQRWWRTIPRCEYCPMMDRYVWGETCNRIIKPEHAELLNDWDGLKYPRCEDHTCYCPLLDTLECNSKYHIFEEICDHCGMINCDR